MLLRRPCLLSLINQWFLFAKLPNFCRAFSVHSPARSMEDILRTPNVVHLLTGNDS